jgi:hypothetical protein
MYPWGLGYIGMSRQAFEDELIKHEHRMVGSEVKFERYIKEITHFEPYTEAIKVLQEKPIAGFQKEGDMPTLGYKYIEKRYNKPIKKKYIMEKIVEYKWNKYTGLDEKKVLSENIISELPPEIKKEKNNKESQ